MKKNTILIKKITYWLPNPLYMSKWNDPDGKCVCVGIGQPQRPTENWRLFQEKFAIFFY